MAYVELIRNDAPDLLPSSKTGALAHVHKHLPEQARKQLKSVSQTAPQKIEAIFKENALTLILCAASCSLKGDITPANMDLAMGFVADKQTRGITVKTNDPQVAQLAWLSAQDYLVGTNITPTAESVKTLENEIQKLQPIGDFFEKGKEITVHAGTTPPARKTLSERLLETLAHKKGKFFKCMRVAVDFVRKNKTGLNIGGMLGAFMVGGPVAMALYSQVDKARRAHGEATRRRAEEKRKFELLAEFAVKGINPPEDLKKKNSKFYTISPYVRFAGHLATRLAGTIALTAVAGPIVGATASSIITTSKTVFDTKIIQSALLRAIGKKSTGLPPVRDRVHRSLQTAVGVEIEKEKFDKIWNRLFVSKKKQRT